MISQNETHLSLLEKNASIFWREPNPKASSCIQLKRLLETYATFENWENVIDLASKAVVHLNKNYERAEFYYIWIIGLYETNDVHSLLLLAKHLIGMGNEYSVFNCLAIMAYTFAGKQKTALNLLKKQRKQHNIKNRYYKEAFSLFLTTLKSQKHINRGILLLKKLCANKSAGYFTWRNCLRILSQNNCEKSMSRMYNLMHVRFPYAHEPYITSALIAIDEKNWPESIRILIQIIKDNPSNKDAIIALVHSYAENNELEKAWNLINNKKNLFDEQDLDYNCTMAKLLEQKVNENNNKYDCEDAILYYDKAISLSNFFRFPTGKLEISRNKMEILNKTLERSNKLLLNLENFLQKNNRIIVSSISSFANIKQNFKLNSK